MNSVAYTDIRLKDCKHPRLREALMFPQRSYLPPNQRVQAEPEVVASSDDEPGVGLLLAQKTLEVVFKGISLLTLPMERMSGGLFATHRVKMVA